MFEGMDENCFGPSVIHLFSNLKPELIKEFHFIAIRFPVRLKLQRDLFVPP